MVGARTGITAWLCVAAATVGTPAAGASFPCSKAKTPLERKICADPALSRLDDDLAASYKRALTAFKPAGFIRDTQRLWLREVASCWTVGRKDALGDRSCADQYRARIDRLKLYSGAVVYADSKDFDPESAMLLVYSENGTRWLEWFGHYMPDAYRPEPYPDGFLAYDRDKIVEKAGKSLLEERQIEVKIDADKLTIPGDGILLSARQGPISGTFKRISR